MLDQWKPGSRPGVCKNPSFLVAMVRSSGFFYPLLGFASCTAIFYMWFGNSRFHFPQPELAFVGRNGTQLYLEGKPFFVNGWNSYWLMDQSVEDFSRHRVRSMFQKCARMGLTVCRTWAFNDGSYHALQVSPGKFDERVFQVPYTFSSSISPFFPIDHGFVLASNSSIILILGCCIKTLGKYSIIN